MQDLPLAFTTSLLLAHLGCVKVQLCSPSTWVCDWLLEGTDRYEEGEGHWCFCL